MQLKILKYNSVKSTNEEAIKLIKKNKTKPKIIISKNQTKGKGTMGKKWISKKGNFFATILFELTSKNIKPEEISILNSFLIRDVLKKYTKYKIKVKWPNDLLINSRKDIYLISIPLSKVRYIQILRSTILVFEVCLCHYCFLKIGLIQTSSLFAIGPLIVTALSVIFLKEKVGWKRWTAILLGFNPLTAMLLGALLIGEEITLEFIVGFLMVVSAVVLSNASLKGRQG